MLIPPRKRMCNLNFPRFWNLLLILLLWDKALNNCSCLSNNETTYDGAKHNHYDNTTNNMTSHSSILDKDKKHNDNITYNATSQSMIESSNGHGDIRDNATSQSMLESSNGHGDIRDNATSQSMLESSNGHGDIRDNATSQSMLESSNGHGDIRDNATSQSMLKSNNQNSEISDNVTLHSMLDDDNINSDDIIIDATSYSMLEKDSIHNKSITYNVTSLFEAEENNMRSDKVSHNMSSHFNVDENDIRSDNMTPHSMIDQDEIHSHNFTDNATLHSILDMNTIHSDNIKDNVTSHSILSKDNIHSDNITHNTTSRSAYDEDNNYMYNITLNFTTPSMLDVDIIHSNKTTYIVTSNSMPNEDDKQSDTITSNVTSYTMPVDDRKHSDDITNNVTSNPLFVDNTGYKDNIRNNVTTNTLLLDNTGYKDNIRNNVTTKYLFSDDRNISNNVTNNVTSDSITEEGDGSLNDTSNKSYSLINESNYNSSTSTINEENLCNIIITNDYLVHCNVTGGHKIVCNNNCFIVKQIITNQSCQNYRNLSLLLCKSDCHKKDEHSLSLLFSKELNSSLTDIMNANCNTCAFIHRLKCYILSHTQKSNTTETYKNESSIIGLCSITNMSTVDAVVKTFDMNTSCSNDSLCYDNANSTLFYLCEHVDADKVDNCSLNHLCLGIDSNNNFVDSICSLWQSFVSKSKGENIAHFNFTDCSGFKINKCETGHIYNRNRSTCVQRSLEDSCENDLDCSPVIHSFCNNKTCLCKSGYVDNGSGNCEKFKLSIHACVDDLDCSQHINTSHCGDNSTCACDLGYITSNNDTNCQKRSLFDDCDFDRDCNVAINNSFCYFGSCVCSSGYIADVNNQSCGRRQISDTCEYDTDCVDAVRDSVCDNRTCTCKPGYASSLELDQCTKRKINDPCETEVDCNNAISHSFCSEEICTCEDEYDEINNGTKCVKRPNILGDPCYFPSQCLHIDKQAVCKDVCMCPAKHFVTANKLVCVKYPTKLAESCSENHQCVSAVRNSECGTGKLCQCKRSYFTDKNGTFCRAYPAQIKGRCLATEHCKFIDNTICENEVCKCTYKYEPSPDMWSCIPRQWISNPKPSNIWLGALCNLSEETPCPQWNITNQKCSSEDGRVNYRCRCKPGYANIYNAGECNGYANIYNAGECNEIQTYHIRLNITQELGCDPKEPKEKDALQCYTFSKARFIKQYSNNNTGKYRDMKLRIQILGLYHAFNKTRLWSRIVAAEVMNMTEIPGGFQTNALVHITEDYYNVMNASVLEDNLIGYLEKHDGKLGSSKLKIGQPYRKNIYTYDFNECSDWNGQASDCSVNAWCINTYGSYMCSCKYGFDDLSLDTLYRPGRICKVVEKKIVLSQSCSDGRCETNWTRIGLSMGFLLILLIGFLVYEIYSKKQEIQKLDPTYVPVKRSTDPKVKCLSANEEERLTDGESYNHDDMEQPPVYTEEP